MSPRRGVRCQNGNMTSEQAEAFAAEMKSAGAVEVSTDSLDVGDWVALNGQVGTIMHIGQLTLQVSTGDYMPRSAQARALLLPPDFLSRQRDAARRAQRHLDSPAAAFRPARTPGHDAAPAAPASTSPQAPVAPAAPAAQAAHDALLNPFSVPQNS